MLIRNKEIELAASYVSLYENSKNPYESRRTAIGRFVKENVTTYVDVDQADAVKTLADAIIATGVKTADAHHLAYAILAGSDFFLTTDDRLLKHRTDKLRISDPVAFILEREVFGNDNNQ